MHPCRMEQIDSVKINPSLVMMREWSFHPFEKCSMSRRLSCITIEIEIEIMHEPLITIKYAFQVWCKKLFTEKK